MGTSRGSVALAICLGACAAFGCGQEAPAGPPPERPATPIRIGYSRLRISLPIFVAAEQGIFRRHGIDADLVMYDTAQPLMQSLVGGQLDVGGYTALPITYGGMLRSGTRLLFVTALLEDQQHRISYLLRQTTPAGQEPTIRSVADLRGRRVGILPTMAYRAWLLAILEGSGIGPDEVTIQQIEPLLQPQTLASGGVDALFTNDPAATAAIVGGFAEPIDDFVEVPRVLGEPFLFGSFNVRADWAEAHPEPLERLVAALDEAVLWIAAHPREAKRAMAPYLPAPFRPHTDLYPDARYLPSTETREEDFVRAAEQMRARGILAEVPDLRGLVVGPGR